MDNGGGMEMVENMEGSKSKKKMKRKRPSRGQRASKKQRRAEINYEETNYVIEGGKRHVLPYQFVHETFVKQAWIGRTVLNVFTEDFGSGSKEFYVCKILLHIFFLLHFYNGVISLPRALQSKRAT